MNQLNIIRQGFVDHPAMDVAVSYATLEAVARGELGEVLRLHVPAAVVAFGRADRVREGYPFAVRAAEAHGFAAVERLAGGRAAVFHEATLAFAWTAPMSDPRAGIRDRFESITTTMVSAFRSLGVDAHVGEIPGEYCPGQWSVNAGGRVKVMGVGQKLVKGAAHVGGVVVVDDDQRIRDVLIPVYRALGLDWDPRTSGSLADLAPGLDTNRVTTAILGELGRRFNLEDSALPESVIENASALISQHLQRVA